MASLVAHKKVEFNSKLERLQVPYGGQYMAGMCMEGNLSTHVPAALILALNPGICCVTLTMGARRRRRRA